MSGTTRLTPRKRSSYFLYLGLLLFLLVSGVPQAQVALQSASTSEQAPGGESTPQAQSPEKNKQEQDGNEAYKHSAVVAMIGSKLGMTTTQAATAFEVTNFV